MTTLDFDPSDARACRKVIAQALADRGLFNRLTARTIGFQDLAGADMVFVTIHDWTEGARFAELETIARAHGFRVQAR